MQLTRVDSGRLIERTALVRHVKRGPGRMRAVIASDRPVRRWDSYRAEYTDEVLWLPGVRWRTDKKQLPLLDGEPSTVQNVVGSVRNIERVGSELIGNVFFCRDARSQEMLGKIQAGELQDFHIEFNQHEALMLGTGERFHDIGGPCKVVTRWVPLWVRIGFGDECDG